MYLWTSEAVSCGHPDKLADQVADAVLDAHLAQDPLARVACEVTLTANLALITGEIASKAKIDLETVVRKAICAAGYDRSEFCYDGNKISILNALKQQSPEISQAVVKEDGTFGAGDQGMMFGYACREHAPNLMPLTHQLAFALIQRQEEIRRGLAGNQKEAVLCPDAKSQVTIAYEDGVPQYIDTIVFSTQHVARTTLEELRHFMLHQIGAAIKLADEANQMSGGVSLLSQHGWEKTRILINPAGAWSFGGPAADTGLSGRKIVVDNYGSDCPIGGGSFSGKDPTKVDRSAAYMARYLAKNIVANGLADTCQVQLAYAIGVVEPVSVRVQATKQGADTSELNRQLAEKIKSVDLTPKGIMDRLGLRQPIYQQTASGGHFGREEFPWERLDLKF